MELRQLEYFVAVAEEANFTRAAERVHIAQSGVSAQIRRLERELGQPLFERSARAVSLTDVGAAVLPHARAALAAAGGVRLTVEQFTGLLRGQVAVGMVVSSMFLDLPGLLESFYRAHPGVEITLSEDNSDVLLEGLESGALDVAVVGLAGPRPDAIDGEVLIDEPFVAAVSLDDPLAARSRIQLTTLRGRALISLPPGTGQRTALDDACALAGIRPRVAFEATDPAMLAEFAARGLGVAIVPRSLAAHRRDRLHALTITRPQLRGRIELAWKSGGPLRPAARAFAAHARAVLASAKPGR